MTEQLTQALAHTATAFRQGQESYANACYRQNLEAITQIVTQSVNRESYTPVLEYLMQAQQRQDWLSIADTLEFELTALISAEDESSQ